MHSPGVGVGVGGVAPLMPSDRGGTVVLLAFHYPPMIGAASERIASFARHLPASGWEPIVVTTARGLYHRDLSYAPPPVRTLRTRSPEPSRLFRRRRRSTAATPELVPERSLATTGDRLRRFVRDYVYVPDGQALWIPFAVAGLRRALSIASGPTVLLSTSVPYSAHLAARSLAQRVGVPWIAEFRDPWVHVHQAIRPRAAPRRRIDGLLERRVVASATAVVVTSELTRKDMARRYPSLEERFWVVRNGFEPLQSSASPPEADAPLELVHAGTVPPQSPIEPLLLGIDAIARRRPGEIRLIVLGPPARWRQAASAMGGAPWLDVRGAVSPSDARLVSARASANLLVCPGEEYDEHIAAKLMEYFGVRRPVLAIISPSGEMATLSREYGDVRVLSRFDAETVEEQVERLLSDHRRGLLQRTVQPRRRVEDLTRYEQAQRLAAVLELARAAT
jgi:hypothetical protein